MSALLNLGSLLLGLVAWALPIFNLMRQNKTDHRSGGILSLASFSACGISLCLQILEFNHRVNMEDWSALMDTSWAVAMVAVFMLTVTIILNVIALTRKADGDNA